MVYCSQKLPRISGNTFKFLFLAFVFFIHGQVLAQLSGNYTIGGTSPNYTSIGAAVSALNSSGVSGNVTFSIRQGTYTERIAINSISGASATKTVTFKPDTGNTTGVTIQYTNSSPSLNYVVKLNGSKYLTFKNIKFKAAGSTYSTVFELRGLNDFITIDSCTLEMNATSTGSTTVRCGVYELSGSGNRTSNFTLSNNTVTGGSYGIYAYGYSSGTWYQKDWKIEKNTIKDWYYSGVFLNRYFDTVLISNNEITQRSNGSGTSYGIYNYLCYKSNIESNKIVMPSTSSYGINSISSYGVSNFRQRIANNMVSLTGASASGARYGIYANSLNYTDVVFNSIYSKEGTGYSLYGGYGSGNVYKNNAIHNASSSTSSYAMYFLGSSTKGNNCAWNPIGVVSNTTLASTSINKNPLFSSLTNLHTSSIDLNNAGSAISGITKDFDGQTRSTSVPDIGADEFTPPSNDAGIESIANYTVCAGSNSIKVRLKNYGSSTLSSATINWTTKVNSGSPTTQTSYSFSGSLASGKDTILSIGNYSMVATNTYVIKAWTASPNSSTDGNNSNDSASHTYTTSLSGIYTVGGTSPNYATIQLAATAVKNKGVCGPVTFRIRPGSYNEAVVIDSGKGMSATNTVTFTKDPTKTGNVLWYRNGRPITFRNTHHVIIKDLVIETRSFSNVIYFLFNNNDITIKNNTIRGANTSSSSASYAIIYNTSSSTYQNHRVTIDSNKFKRGSMMTYWLGASSSTTFRERGNKIRYNTYDSAGYYGIFTQYQDSLEIIGNVIRDHLNSGNFYGIYSSVDYNRKIENNEIYQNIRSSGTGIYLNSGGGTSGNHSKFINNYVYQEKGRYGIYASSVAYTDYYYNTIRLKGTNVNSYAAYFNYGNTYLKNNNISNEADGYVLFVRSSVYLPLSDYNNLYTTSTTKFAYGAGNRNTFALWKSGMGRDNNSKSVNPYWQSANGPKPNNGTLNGAGSTISGVTKDINGTTRSSSPDIGCIEFTPSTNDAGLSEVVSSSVCPGSNPVKVRLHNYGNNTLTQARVQWTVKTNSGSAVSQTAYTWTGSLASYKDTIVSLGNYTFVSSNNYIITAYTDRANNTTDIVKSNDTAKTISLTPKLKGTFTVGGTSPKYATLNIALTDLKNKGVCGPVTLNIRAGTYYGRNNFGVIPGVSSVNTITVQTDPGASAKADLYYSGYPILMSGAEHVILKNLKIRVTGNSSVVYFTGSNNHITFDNDSLVGRTINSSSAAYSVFYDYSSSAAIQRDLTIKNCVIQNGSYGIYMYGNGSSGIYAQYNIEISNNKILNFYYYGVHAQYCPSLKVKNNTITDRNTYQYTNGVNAYYCDSSEVSGNKITIKGNRGIDVERCYGNTATDGARIYNNFIQYSDTSLSISQYGIYGYDNRYATYAFNSVNIVKGNTLASPIFTRYGSVIKILNNNFINKGTGYAQYHLSPSAITSLDYNNIQTKGTYIGYYSGYRTNLAAWKSGTGTGKSVNTINVDPQYFSQFDLHAQNSAIDGKGTPVTGITTDIDGQTRSTSIPDIGADEITIVARDAGIASVNSSSVCLGSNAVKVTLRNYGTNTLTATTIRWRVSANGGSAVNQTAFSFSGSLASGKDTILSLGNYTFSKGSAYVITANTDGFNSSTDQNKNNDSASSNSIKPKMSGLYTVGSASGNDWKTIDSAVTALENIGVCGPVTIYVKSGNYSESVVFNSIPGVSTTNIVTILGDTSSSSSKPDWYSSGIPLSLYAVNYVKFKNLKIRTTGFSSAVRFNTSNSYLTFEGNEIEGRNVNSTSSSYATIYNTNSSAYQQNHISFKNNKIKYGSYSIYWLGWSTGTNAEKGNKFIGNEITDSYYMGIYVQSQDSLLVDSNLVRTKNLYTNCYGLYVNSNAHIQLMNNKLELRNGGYGLYLSNSSGTVSDSVEVQNNFITVGGTGYSVGLYSSGTNYANIYHNSVHLYNTRSNSYGFYQASGLSNTVKNNNFYNSGGGVAIRITNRNTYNGNYNNLKSSGTVLGYYSGNRTTLGAWKAATLDDNNSVSVNPNYKDTFDLHSTSASLNNAGVPVGVLLDIDGETRSTTTPDIGADEFNSIPLDLNLRTLVKAACEGTQPVKINIKNDGTTALTSGNIKWTLSTNGGTPVAQTTFKLSGSLASLKDTTITLGNVTFNRSNYYDILVYVDSINGKVDQNKNNDSLSLDSTYAAMSGTYTVGGSSPDFSTITKATDALKSRGVCGHTFINIRPATYFERIYLPAAINGADTGSTITFQSDTASSTQASLRYSSIAVYLQGAHFVKINNLNLRTTGATNVIYVWNSNDVQITNNNLEGYITNSSASGYSVIRFYKSTIGSKNFLVKGNTIKNGSAGLYVDGNGRTADVEIQDNTITDFNTYGVYTYRADSLIIAGNTLQNKRSSTSFIYALYPTYSIGYKIFNNKIDFNGTYVGNANRTGINLIGSDGVSLKRAEVYNNFIAIGGKSTNARGIELNQSDYVNVDHNSVNIYAASTSSRSLSIISSYNQSFRNNIWANSGGGYAIYTNVRPTVSNYNDIYTSGSILAYYSGNRTNLAAWRSGTSRDFQSVSVKPYYFTNTNLHTSSAGLNSKGTNLTYITKDIDGDARTSVRDIGADEFSPIARDAGLKTIAGLLCPGSNAVKVEMTNFGTQTITSAKINWAISTNSGAFVNQAKANYSGSISSGNKTIVTLGNFNFLNGNIYSIRAVVDTINNLADGNSVNDTSLQNNVRPALSGVYSVGTGGDFISIAAADSALDQSGVCGAVVLELNQGTYNESVTMGNYNGVSASNTITLRADSSNTSPVYWTSAARPLILDNASFMTFEGLNITTTGNTNAVYMMNDINSISFKNNVFTGSGTTNSSYVYSNVYYVRITNKKMRNVSFENNTFNKGSYGFYLAASTSYKSAKLSFKNNAFNNYRYTGISASYADSLTIESNTFKNGPAGGTTGISVTYANQFSIRKNKVDNTLIGSGSGTVGINVYYSNGTSSSRGVIANNFFASKVNNFSALVSLIGNTYTDFYYNSIHAIGSASTSKALQCQNGSNTRYYNNNIVNMAGGYAVYVSGTAEYSAANNNNLYSTSSSWIGYYKGSNKANLSAWRTSSGQDMQSVSGNPFYKGNGDLHAFGIVTNNAGRNLTGYTTDIDGETRSTTTPDIGADEYTASPNDAGLDSISRSLFCLGSNNVFVKLTNYGTDTLKTATINWRVISSPGTSTNQIPFSWTGSLLTGKSVMVNIGSFSLGTDTSYQVFANSSSPNGKTDGFIGNDSTQNMTRKAAMHGTYIVAKTGVRDYASLVLAVNDLNARGVCGPVNIKVKDGTYSGSVTINSIDGSSATNIVVIESDSTNAKRAVLNSFGYTVKVQGVNYLTLRGFNIETSRYSAVYLTGANNHVTIENNKIENSYKQNYYNYYYYASLAIYNNTNVPSSNINVLNNTIHGGQFGIYAFNSQKANKTVIEGNHISDFRNLGIYVLNDLDLTIKNNSVFDSTFAYGRYGIHTQYCAVDLIGNKVVVNSPSSGFGVHIQQSIDPTNIRKKVINNAITFNQYQNGYAYNYGLYLEFCKNTDVYYNSVMMDGGTNTNSRALLTRASSSTTNMSLRNNSFVNNNGGYALYANTTILISSSDYNNLYSNGTYTAYRAGSRFAQLSNWRSGTGFDANSTSAYANYMSAYNMAPNHIALDGTATVLSAVSKDIDGVNRGSSPDIGAYQFSTRKDDAGAVTLVSKQLCNGSQSVVLAIKNFGGDTLKSARVYWAISRNGGAYVNQTRYNWTGVMSPGDVDSNVVVGTFNFIGGSYKIRAFTSIPNNKTDELQSNDTLNSDLYIKLNGTYTLGDTSSDFKTWNSFADAINKAGVCGPVTIKAKRGTYNENISLNKVLGLTATDKLIITADTGTGSVILTDSITPLAMLDMKYVTVKNIEINATGKEPAIRMDGFNHHINIDSNRIVGPLAYSNTGTESAIYILSNATSSATANNSLQFVGNKIENGSAGIYLQGSNTSWVMNNIKIEGNEISNFYTNGVYAYSVDNMVVTLNKLSSSAGYSSNGMHLYYSDKFSIQRNKVELTTTGYSNGISIYRSNGLSSGYSHLVNNFIQVAGGNGLNIRNSNYINSFYNSVNINPNKLTSTSGNAVSTYGVFSVDFKNNSFANMANGYVYDRAGGFTSNNNNLYTTGNLLSRNNVQDLAGWRTASGQDVNSVSADPIYLSATDLHANQTLMDSSAAVLGSFTIDIDGQNRDNTKPDMGADEFDLIKNVGIVDVILPESYRARKWTSTAFSKTQEIEVVVRNFGPVVKDIPVEYQFNGTTVQDTIKTTLGAGKLDTFKFATTVNMDTIGTYALSVFTAMPNDQFIQNDTMEIEIVTLENGKVKLPFTEDFENVKDTSIFENYLGMWDLEEWDFVTNGGRLQTKSGKKVGGSQAISLDRTPNGPIKKNELILNLNLSRYDSKDSVYLDFDFIDHRDERHAGDSVWVRGSDTSAWIGIYDLWRNRRTNRVKEVRNIEITSAFAAASQMFTESFQVKFGQEDNQRLPGDGRTFDNIVVRAVSPYDLTIKDAAVEYRQVPKDMADNRFKATIGNQGYLTADSVYFRVDVAGMVNRSMVDSLRRNEDTLMTTTDSLTIKVAGVQTAYMSAEFNGIDKCWENDSMDINFSITDTVLARDDNVVDSTFGFAGSTGKMGTVLEVFRKDTLTSVSFYLNFPKIGDTLKAEIYTVVNDTVGSKLLGTTTMVINSNASGWYNLPIKCMEVLNKGKYLVSVDQSSTSYLTLGVTKNNYTPNVSWINQGSGWSAFEDSLKGYLFSIHANFGKYDLATINAPKALCLNSDPIVLTSNRSGGKFFGFGVVKDSIFDPSVTGFGTYIIKYAKTKSNGCFDTTAISILVDSLPVVSFANPAAVCNNDGLVALTGGLPLGGSYFGNGVTSNRLNSNSLSPGMHTIRYRYAKPISGCADTSNAQVRVKKAPTVSFASVSNFCINDSLFVFTQGSPKGGKYSGVGVSNDSTFNVNTAGVGSHNITYTFVDTNACSDKASRLVMVNDTPTVELGADTTACFQGKVVLDAKNVGSTYKWNTGASSKTISVTQTGVYDVIVTDGNGCKNGDTIEVSFNRVCVGLDEALSSSSINYFPNPNNGQFYLKLSDVSEGEVELTIRNVQGQVISIYNWNNVGGELLEEINLDDQSPGVYFLDLKTQDGRATHRITLSR